MPSTGKLLKLDIGVTTGLYEPPTRILVVCSSHARGVYLSEFAEPFNILRKKFGGKERLEFVIASPKGGSVSLFHAYHWPISIALFYLDPNRSYFPPEKRHSTK